MNWGWKIALVYIGFVAMILTLVFKANKENIDLVAPDYYAQELVYQARINAIARASLLADRPAVKADSSGVQITMPVETHGQITSGEVRFFRPSDAALDRSFPLIPEANGSVMISPKTLTGGYYLAQISWMMKGESYYFEESILIP